jgi:N-acylglucosamine 2-epimerase
MDPTLDRLAALSRIYNDELLGSVVPFWLNHSLDDEYGGYLHCLERDGTPFDHDKFLWMQGRAVWTWSTLYNDVEPRPEYLEAARLGAEFLREHAWDRDGRMPFALERDGTPFIKPRDIFSECFLATGLAAYYTASGEEWARAMSLRAYDVYLDLSDLPETHDGSTYPGVRPALSHGLSFIKVAMSQELRRHYADARFAPVIASATETILGKHVHPERRAIFEYVTPSGGAIPGPMGRQLSPGHGVESMGFILNEAALTRDAVLVDRACDVILWALEAGWDQDHGGLLYFVDAERPQNRKLEGDMKLWWVHSEALVATLLAFQMTGRQEFWDWFELVHDWSWARFRDPLYGEWFGYLHRDGTVALTLKGSMWKGFFHLPRALMQLRTILDQMAGEGWPHRSSHDCAGQGHGG